MANVYDDDEETLRFADEGDYLDERYLIDRAEHEAHAEGNEEEPDAVCGETYEHDWRPGDPECRRCHADLSAWSDDRDDDEPGWPYGVSYGPEFFADGQE